MAPSSSRNFESSAYPETLRDEQVRGGHAGPLRFVLLGEGLALAAVVERLRQKGHTIVGIVAIDPQIDTGLVLAQRCFSLSPNETTASLNLRCTVAALESFEEVLAYIEQGRLEGRPQDRAAADEAISKGATRCPGAA
jgi:hypothetical protein